MDDSIVQSLIDRDELRTLLLSGDPLEPYLLRKWGEAVAAESQRENEEWERRVLYGDQSSTGPLGLLVGN